MHNHDFRVDSTVWEAYLSEIGEGEVCVCVCVCVCVREREREKYTPKNIGLTV